MGWSIHQVGGHACRVFLPRQPNEHGFVVVALHDLLVDSSSPARSSGTTDSAAAFGTEFTQPVFEKSFESLGLTVVAPLTGHSWWADRIASEFDEIITPAQFVCQHVVPWIAAEFNAGSAVFGEVAGRVSPTGCPRLGLLGVGMGGQGALRISYRHPNLFPVVAAINPDLDYQRHILTGDQVLYAMYEEVERARQDTALLHVHPLNWPRHQFFCCDPDDWHVFNAVDRLRMKLNATGVPFESDSQPVKGLFGRRKPYLQRGVHLAMDFILERLNKERLRVV